MTNFSKKIEKFRSGDLALLPHLENLCSLIEEQEPRLSVFVPGTFNRKQIIDQGKRLFEKFTEPAERPSLFGLTLGVKDIFNVKGFSTRCGSMLPEDEFKGDQASSVSRLMEAGAVIMGKTVTAEFAMFEPGPTKNPFDHSRSPGGSSSGSAAGLAAGFFSSSLGTQTIGSIIRPAAYCGVIGFKPSYGRIPVDGVIPASPSLDHVGFFCSDTSGLSLISETLIKGWKPSGKNRSDAQSKTLFIPDEKYIFQASERERVYFFDQIEDLRALGYRIEKCDFLSDISSINKTHRKIMRAEAARIHSRWYSEYGGYYRAGTKKLIEDGGKITDRELEELQNRLDKERTRLKKQIADIGANFFLSPSATDRAPKGLESTGDPVMNLPWTFIGLPVISLPTFFDSEGLPHGLQIAGAFGTDEELVSFAESISGHFTQEPALLGSLTGHSS